MRHWTEGGAAAIAAMLIATGPAGAEITAAEAWQGIVDYYASMGQSVTAASQGQEGDTLVVRGAEFATHLPEGDARLSVEEIRLKEMGDGRVEVTMSPDIPLSVKMTSSKDEAIDMAMKLTQSGMTFVISGDNTATDYTFNSATMGIDVESLTVNGEAVPMTISGNLANLAGGPDNITAIIIHVSDQEPAPVSEQVEQPRLAAPDDDTEPSLQVAHEKPTTLPEGKYHTDES